MGWKKQDPNTGVTVEFDDDVTEAEADELMAADADGSTRKAGHPEEAGR